MNNKYSQGTVVRINKHRIMERVLKQTGIYNEWKHTFDYTPKSVMILGFTNKRNGKIVTMNEDVSVGYSSYSYLDIHETVRGYMAIELTSNGRYVKPIFITDDCIVKE